MYAVCVVATCRCVRLCCCVLQARAKIERLRREHSKLLAERKLEEEQRDQRVQHLKALKFRLRNQFAGVTRDETTGATVVCEEPGMQ